MANAYRIRTVRVSLQRLVATICLLASSGTAFSEGPPCQKLIVSGNPEYPPLLWRDPGQSDRLIGAVPAFLKEVMAPLGVEVEVRDLGSWARVQRLARTGEIDMVAGAFITSERIRYMDYLLPPLTHLPTTVWVPKGREFVYRHWPDLKSRRGSTLIGNSFGQNFDAYADKNLNIEAVRTIEQSFQMAEVDRVDYVLYESLQGRVKLADMELLSGFVALDVPISREGLFFTFSKKSACNDAQFREEVAEQVFKGVKGGRMIQLIDEYIDIYTAR